MSWVALLAGASAALGSGFLPGVLFMLLAWHIFLAPFVSSGQQLLLITAIGLSLPVTVAITGLLLDMQTLGPVRGRIFSTLAWALTMMLVLEAPETISFAGAAVAVVQSGSAASATALLLHTTSVVLYSSGLIACVLLAAQLVAELPVHCLTSITGTRVEFCLPSLRPLVMAVLVAMSFDLVYSAAGAWLWPSGGP